MAKAAKRNAAKPTLTPARPAAAREPPTVAPPEFDDYWQLRMDGATARLKAAQQIVSHTGTRGSLAENLLRELVRDFLPQRWAVATGFVMDAATKVRSNQLDLLIYDQLNTSPVFRDGELVVLPPRSARVVIEVKSDLDDKDIPKAYANICSVRRIDPGVWGYGVTSSAMMGCRPRRSATTFARGRPRPRPAGDNTGRTRCSTWPRTS